MKQWTKEGILELLKTNDKAVGQALLALLRRQTAAEQVSMTTHNSNGIGFTAFDAEYMTSMANFFQQRGYLTPKQLAVLRKEDKRGHMRIGKYHAQLLEEANKRLAERAASNQLNIQA